jgi:hypothetical protein
VLFILWWPKWSPREYIVVLQVEESGTSSLPHSTKVFEYEYGTIVPGASTMYLVLGVVNQSMSATGVGVEV